jgi:hypothetical protein
MKDRAEQPTAGAISSRRRMQAVLAALIVTFLAAGGTQIGALGIPSEEILPHLFLHPRVAADRTLDTAELSLAVPYDLPDGEERSGLVLARHWPVFSFIVPPVSYPILAEVWQSGHLSYVAVACAPLLGGGIEGLRRTALLAGALGLLLVALLARRLEPTPTKEPWLGVIAALWLGSSVSFLFPHRTAYLIESAPPLFAVLVLYLALDGRRSRFIVGGLAAGLALSMKATTGWFFIGMTIYLALSRRWPRQPPLVWLGGVGAALLGLAPLLVFLVLEPNPQIFDRTSSFLSDPSRALVRLPHTAWIVAAYLGHPGSVLEPLLAGQRSVHFSTWAPALPAAATLFSVFRVVRRTEDRQPELLWLCVMPAVLVFGAWLYGAENSFQISLLIAPIYAVVVARALYALHRVLAERVSSRFSPAIVALAVLPIQATELTQFVLAHRRVANPMLAMEGQRQLVEALVERGVEAPLTTTYNSAGFYEFLSGGLVRPTHLYPLLQPRPGLTDRENRDTYERAWMIAISDARGPVVLPLGYNLFEGGGQDPDVVRSAFFSACRNLSVSARETARFPATGPPTFGLYEIAGEPNPRHPIVPVTPPVTSSPRQRPPEQDAGRDTRAFLGGLEPGATLGELIVDSMTEPVDGAVIVRARSPSGARATLEVRLSSATPPPPAESGRYAIYYRNPEDAVSREALVEAARALAARMDEAEPGVRSPPGLTPYPAAEER